MASKNWQALSVVALAALASIGAQAATVSFSGALTTFQSALSAFQSSGNGSLNNMALTIDPNLPPVAHLSGDPQLYPQSHTVTLAPGTRSVRFEYTDFIGTVNENPNLISFEAAASAQVNPGDSFKVGTLSYTNGFWYPHARIGLSITTASPDAAFDGHTFTGSIIVAVSSPVPFDPADYIANADYFYLEDVNGPLDNLGSVRVYERDFQPPGNPGNTGTVDLYARIGSLVPTSFENPSGGVFLSQSLEPITSAVPEPQSVAMLLAGLAVVGSVAARRHRIAHQA